MTRKEIIILALILLMGAFLRFYCLGEVSLWSDEGYTAYMATHNPKAILEKLESFDDHPPLYYIFLHYWGNISRDSFFLRIPSAVAGILSIFFLFLLARELFNTNIGLTSAFFLSISQGQIMRAQEIRMYSFLALEVLIILYAVINILRGRKPLFYWFIFSIFTLFSWLTNYIAFLLTFSLNIFVFFYRKKIDFDKWILFQMLSVACFLPWIPSFFYQLHHSGGPPDAGFGIQMGKITSTFSFFFLGKAVCAYGSFIFWIAFLLSVMFFLLGFWRGIFEKKMESLFLLFNLIIPLLIMYVVSICTNYEVYYLRYLTPFSQMLFIFFALAASFTRKRFEKILVFAGILFFIVFNVYHLYMWYFVPSFQMSNWKAAAGYINEKVKPSDGIIIQSPFQHYVFEYYFEGKNKIYPVSEDEVRFLPWMKKNHPRLWLATCYGWQSDPELKAVFYLHKNCRFKEIKIFENLTEKTANIVVILYETSKQTKEPKK